MSVHEFYNKLLNLQLEKLKEKAVESNKDFIVALNQAQLHDGVTFKGDLIQPSYTLPYLKKKLKLSSYQAPAGTPDLYLNGDFYAGMDIDVIDRNGEYNIIDWDELAGFKTNRYTDLLGLSVDSVRMAQIPCTNTLIELIKNELSN